MTVAVLGYGADVAYPASHRSLWRRIGEQGLVLSELPPGTGAWRWTFPARNRIVVGLCGMTVVVEAAQRSGSLVTADLAANLGRELGAVPGPVNSRLAAARTTSSPAAPVSSARPWRCRLQPRAMQMPARIRASRYTMNRWRYWVYAARFPDEVPLVNGELERIALTLE